MKDRWSQLSMSEKSDLMSLYIQNGINSLEEIKKHYNSFADGGRVDNPPTDPVLKGRQPKANFYQRLLNPNRQTIPDWQHKGNIATHKMSYATNEDNTKAVVYPEVQEINGKLYDFTDPRNKEGKWAAYDRAVQTGDTIQMTPAQAEWWTRHYKEFYPSFEFAKGGSLPDHDPDNPYHYHNTRGEKIVITPKDWEANVGKPYFKEIEDAVRAEQAAHPVPEYDEVENPAFTQAYNNLRNKAAGNNGSLAINWWNGKSYGYAPLPEGYSRDKYGIVTDSQGNYYTPLPNRNNSSFSTPYKDIHGGIVEQYYGKVTMPDKTISTLKLPLPVDRIMNINNERENAIQNYINNNTKTIITQEPSIYKYINPIVNDMYLTGNTELSMDPSTITYYNPETKTIESKDEYAPSDKIRDFHINRVKSFSQQVEEQDIRDAFKAAADMGINALYNYNSGTYSTADDYLKDNRNKVLISKGKTLKKQKVPSRQEAEEKAIISLLTNN